jgi:hypothetical protein
MIKEDKIDELKFSGEIKRLLCKNDFYSPVRLNKLLDIINTSSKLNSYVSSSNINYETKTIQLNIRKAYMKKFKDNRYNSLFFYEPINECMDQLYHEYFNDIYSIIGGENLLTFFSLDSSLYYVLSRIGENSLIISLC